MKLYLAGKFADRSQINEYIKQAELVGHTITHNWTTREKAEDGMEKMAECAANDLHGVIDCDLLVCIMTDPKYPYRGTFTELGAALALNKKVIIINPDPKAYCTTNIFYHHHGIAYCNTWAEALEQL